MSIDANYHRLRRASANAAAIGNHSAAISFSERASGCPFIPLSGLAHDSDSWVLGGPEFSDCAVFRTKRAASSAAARIGWRKGDVSRVHNRLHGEAWAITDGWGLVTRSRYDQLIKGRAS